MFFLCTRVLFSFAGMCLLSSATLLVCLSSLQLLVSVFLCCVFVCTHAFALGRVCALVCVWLWCGVRECVCVCVSVCVCVCVCE